MKIALCFAVWNKPYLDFFLEVTLPTYFANGNLPKLSEKNSITTFVATDHSGMQQIKNHPIYKELKEIGEVIFEDFSNEINSSKLKYNLMSKMHMFLIQKCIEKKSVAIIASPDAIISNNSLENAFKYIEEGKKIIIYPCFIRVNKEEIIDSLTKSKSYGKFTSINLSSNELMSFATNSLHEISKSQFLNSKITNTWASSQFIQNKNLILAKAAHLHPYIIDLRELELKSEISNIPLDGGVKDCFGVDQNSIQVINRSKEFGALEISSIKMHCDLLKYTKFNLARKSLQLVKWQKKFLGYRELMNYMKYTFYFYLDNKPVYMPQLFALKIKFFFFNLPSYAFNFPLKFTYHFFRTFLVRLLTKLGLKQPLKTFLYRLKNINKLEKE